MNRRTAAAETARYVEGYSTVNFVGTFPDGSQVLVVGDTVATRPHRNATWSAPVDLVDSEGTPS